MQSFYEAPENRGVTWREAAQRLRREAEIHRQLVDEALTRYGVLHDQQRIFDLGLECIEDEGSPPADEVADAGQEQEPQQPA